MFEILKMFVFKSCPLTQYRRAAVEIIFVLNMSNHVNIETREKHRQYVYL